MKYEQEWLRLIWWQINISTGLIKVTKLKIIWQLQHFKTIMACVYVVHAFKQPGRKKNVSLVFN
jgi:hypothetical protein